MKSHNSICITCGHKCCYGVQVTQYGIETNQAELSQSCTNDLCNFHDGTKCSIYELRPEECKNFECDLIKI